MTAETAGWWIFGAFVVSGCALLFDHHVEISGIGVDVTFKQVNEYADLVRKENPELTDKVNEWQLRELKIIEEWRAQPYYKRTSAPRRPDFNQFSTAETSALDADSSKE